MQYLSKIENLKFILALKNDFHMALYEYAKVYPNGFKFRLKGKEWTYFTKPEAVRHILKTNVHNYTKDFLRGGLGDLLGEGILLTDGKRWATQRRQVAKSFHAKTFSTQIPWVISYGKKYFSNKTEKEIDIHAELNKFMLNNAIKTFLGESIENDYIDEFKDLIQTYSKLASNKLKRAVNVPDWLPTPLNRNMKKTKIRFYELVDNIIENRREQIKNETPQLDALSLMLSHDISQEELRHQALTFIAAGSETTATMTSWACYLLSQNPDKASIMRNELRDVIGDIDNLTSEHLSNLPYTEKVLKETIRLYPVIAGLGRFVQEDDLVDGTKVKAGSITYLSQFSMHKNPTYFPNPLEFQPERFDSEDFCKEAYFPFSIGPRVCVGENLSFQFGKIIMAILFMNHEFILSPNQNITHTSDITLVPKSGVRGVFKKI